MFEPGVYEKGKVSIPSLLNELLPLNANGEVGALVIHVGIVKREGDDGKTVSHLEMESYVEHANKSIKGICEETRAKHNLSFVGIWHLIGKFEIGEPIVLVAVGDESRHSAFEGAKEAVERYKREPALFKKEVYSDSTYAWIEGG